MKHNTVIQTLIDHRAPHITLAHICYKTGFDHKYCKRIMKGVIDAGLAHINREVPRRPRMTRYVLKSRKAMRNLLKNPTKPSTLRDKIWKAIRVAARPTFNRKIIASYSGASPHTVDDFLKLLAREGFIRNEGRSRDGITWLLVKDPGPQRPALSEKPKPKEA